MHILQLILEDASIFELKSQRIDLETLGPSHVVETLRELAGRFHQLNQDPVDARSLSRRLARAECNLVHVYGGARLPSLPIPKSIPYVAYGAPPTRKWSFETAKPPAARVSPLGDPAVPEAVESAYFGGDADEAPNHRRNPEIRTVGSMVRGRSTRKSYEQAFGRICRFREDIEWEVFEELPSRSELKALDLWVDPTDDPEDFSGGVAEAIVAGSAVVASRTPINQKRLGESKAGFLVPPGDANELAHAILNALFKAGGFERKQPGDEFRGEHRRETLVSLYRSVAR